MLTASSISIRLATSLSIVRLAKPFSRSFFTASGPQRQGQTLCSLTQGFIEYQAYFIEKLKDPGGYGGPFLGAYL
jgi:hypothetical protein